MRHLKPAMLAAAMAAAAVALTPGPALAQRAPHRPASSHLSLHVSSHSVLSGRSVRLRGLARPKGSHRIKVVIRGGGGTMLTTASRRNGAFAVRWRPRRPGAYRVRAYGVHDRRMRGSASAGRRITVYRQAAASYYGPGLYGGPLACGGVLEPATLGVAHKTLPCGARVKFLYRGHRITVEVVDRGPYVAGRDFDLTAATKARLRFPDVGVLLSSR